MSVGRRDELADFLRTRRARLSPADLGLPQRPRRRAIGLRREEVAELAEVGITSYTFLEQGRPIKISADALQRIARALRLSQHEVDHLFALAGRPPLPPRAGEEVPPAVEQLVTGLDGCVVSVLNHRLDILARNRAASLVWMDDLEELPMHDRNLVWLMFTSPTRTRMLVDWKQHARRLLAWFRFTYGEHQDDPRFAEIIDRCARASLQFRQWWAEHEVDLQRSTEVEIRHPRAGLLHFSAVSVRPAATPALLLMINTPVPATGTRERLAELLNGRLAPP